MREWANIPNNGIVRYVADFGREFLLLTSPKAIGEVLVVKTDEFIKPPEMVREVQLFAGNGILVAEGDFHKVIHPFLFIERPD
jgi:hypothetical protein